MERNRLWRIARHIAWKMWGDPYKWAGDDPIEGVDCSGFVQECLYEVGALSRKHDRTAHGLWEHYKNVRVENPYAGCLVFWWNSSKTKIRHVEMCHDHELAIGASGGGSKTTTKKIAAAQNAFVKCNPIEGRGIIAGFVDPFLPTAPWGK